MNLNIDDEPSEDLVPKRMLRDEPRLNVIISPQELGDPDDYEEPSWMRDYYL